MNRGKLWLAKVFFKDFLLDTSKYADTSDASSSKSRDTSAGILKRLGFRSGDTASKEFEAPEYDLVQISNGYNTDSYIRQGVDKYIDQVFKEGYDFYGKDSNIVDYIKLRLSYMAEATGTPTGQFLIDIAEDVVKYANCIIAKARAADPNSLPQGVNVTGLNGAQPVAGYFCINVTNMKVKRDKVGTIQGWQQEVEGADKPIKFKTEDIVHIYYKKEKGNAFGTSFLIPVLDDVRALRQSEEDVLRMMYRNIYPFYHVAVGEKDIPGTPTEVSDLQETINSMDVEGGLVTTNRVVIKAIASDQVINAQPYLKYLEDRVFTGLGVPAIMFGRGDTANRSTGDNMTSEMADRIKAIQKTIEMFVNNGIIKELLMEGGFDPVLNPDQNVEFKFKDNDLDVKIKTETHMVYLYEHNAITEDEMRAGLSKDPITDRGMMFQTLITQENAKVTASLKPVSTTTTGTKATNNKQKPTNQHGTKTSPKKTTNSEMSLFVGMISDSIDDLRNELVDYVNLSETTDTTVGYSNICRILDSSSTYVLDMVDEVILTKDDTERVKSDVKFAYDNLASMIEEELNTTQDYNNIIEIIDAAIYLTEESIINP